MTGGCQDLVHQPGGDQAWSAESKELQARIRRRDQLRELMEVMRETVRQNDELKPVIPEDVRASAILNFEHNQLYLDFSPEYKKMPRVYEVLVPGGIL